MRLVLSALLLFVTYTLQAEPLIIGFGDHNAEPYAIIEQDELLGGIIKDLMDEVSRSLKIEVVYKKTPRKRSAQFMKQEKIHAIVLSNPDWFPKQDSYQWSIPLFEETNWILMKADHARPKGSLDDLIGKRLGTIRGYHYPELKELFSTRKIIRDDTDTLLQNFIKLNAGRVDAVIDSNILIQHFIRKYGIDDQFIVGIDNLTTRSLSTALSPLAPVSIEQINSVYRELKHSGRLNNILSKYR